MTDAFDLKALPERERLAYAGAMFAIAATDGEMAKEELALIFETLDQDGLSTRARTELGSYVGTPPALKACLVVLAQGAPELRYGIMVALMDVALADDTLDPAEKAALQDAAGSLHITESQLDAIHAFCLEAKRIRERGLDDDTAADALKKAASGLTGVGIPIAAIYFSGSVLGLSAAGITSGLAALGLGLGMVPGIGVVVVLGIAAYCTVSWLLGGGTEKKKAALQAERERRAQLVIRNLQEAIRALISRLAELERDARTARANEEAIQELNRRLRGLQQLLAHRTLATP